MKSRKLMYPRALVVLATLVIHVGLAAQETKLARSQNQVSLFTEPLLAEFAISTRSEFRLSVDHSLNGTEGTPEPSVTLSPTIVIFTCTQRGGQCACRNFVPVTLTNDGTSALQINRIGISGVGAADFSETNTCGRTLAAGKSCGITVNWNTVPAHASLKVSDNASDSPQTATLTASNICLSQSRSSRSDP